MAKRPEGRKIIIRLKPREADDPADLLCAVEEAFRAGERKDTLSRQHDRDAGSVPTDIFLEERAREHASRVLEEWHSTAGRSAQRSEMQSAANGSSNQQNPMGWLKRARATGWRINVRVIGDNVERNGLGEPSKNGH
jgi:hypothetical protein